MKKADGRRAQWLIELKDLPGDGEITITELRMWLKDRGVEIARSSLRQTIMRKEQSGEWPRSCALGREKRYKRSDLRNLQACPLFGRGFIQKNMLKH